MIFEPQNLKDACKMAVFEVERTEGIEPSYAAWEAAVLPLNYARIVAGMI